ncbi:hypothetical protein chiPu_0021028 [Chiloscyllium punctatum]|uniref:Uncharacterized protein n=1 Tax=Chiloscyllium punctatum TaxID=137246 RepID=A0A401RMG8_CHIPU|nr:hypothetical protein [Chiloscyllium punctatum]
MENTGSSDGNRVLKGSLAVAIAKERVWGRRQLLRNHGMDAFKSRSLGERVEMRLQIVAGRIQCECVHRPFLGQQCGNGVKECCSGNTVGRRQLLEQQSRSGFTSGFQWNRVVIESQVTAVAQRTELEWFLRLLLPGKESEDGGQTLLMPDEWMGSDAIVRGTDSA